LRVKNCQLGYIVLGDRQQSVPAMASKSSVRSSGEPRFGGEAAKRTILPSTGGSTWVQSMEYPA
jgi:hypothetical protein